MLILLVLVLEAISSLFLFLLILLLFLYPALVLFYQVTDQAITIRIMANCFELGKANGSNGIDVINLRDES